MLCFYVGNHHPGALRSLLKFYPLLFFLAFFSSLFESLDKLPYISSFDIAKKIWIRYISSHNIEQNNHHIWHLPKQPPYLASPLLYTGQKSFWVSGFSNGQYSHSSMTCLGYSEIQLGLGYYLFLITLKFYSRFYNLAKRFGIWVLL